MAILTRELSPGEQPVTVARPVDSYARPAMQQGRSGLGEFLSALGKLEPGVTGLMKQVDQEQGDTAEREANMAALKADPKELRAEIESGNYFGQSHRRAQQALGVLDAQNRAFEIGAELDARKARGELVGADPTAIFNELVKPHAEAIKNPLAATAFQKVITPTLQRFQLSQKEAAIKSDIEDKDAQLYRYMTNLHDQVAKDGGDTEAHKKAMFASADFAKNNLLMSPERIEKQMARVAQHYGGQGRKDIVDTIGEYDRNGGRLKDRYGATWDSWSKTAETTADRAKKEETAKGSDDLGARLLQGTEKPEDFNKAVDELHAKDPENFGKTRKEQLKQQYLQSQQQRATLQAQKLTEQQKAHVEGQFIETGADALRGGKGYEVADNVTYQSADGKTQKLSRGELEQRMFERAEGKIEEQGKTEGWDQARTDREKTLLYGSNGKVRPVLSRSFSDLFMGSKAGAPPQGAQLQERLGHLDHLMATDSGQYVGLGGNDKQKGTWLAAYRGAKDFGVDSERAYAIANSRVFQGQGQERFSPSQHEGLVDDTLKKFSGSGVIGGTIAREKAREAVEMQIAAGVDEKKIPERALESLNKSHLIVNGVPVKNNIPGVGNPEVAVEYLKDAAGFFKRNNPLLKDEKFTVAMADDPQKPGQYIAIRTDTGERLTKPGQSIDGQKIKDFVLQWRQLNAEQQKGNGNDPRKVNPSEDGYINTFLGWGASLGSYIPGSKYHEGSK